MPKKKKVQSLEDYIENNGIEIDNEENEEEENDIEAIENKRSCKAEFVKRLMENIRNNCRGVSVLGSIKIAQINKDFTSDLVNVFVETIAEMLIQNYAVYFDQFGVFRITNQKERLVRTPFLNNGEPTIIPSFRLIRFRPSPTLKKRIRGEIAGKIKKDFGGSYKLDEDGNPICMTLKKDEKKNFIESEVWEDGD